MTERRRDDLIGDLEYLASSLEALSIAETPENARLINKRDWIVQTVRSYLIPRVASPAAPLTVVFAGPTGAGKSTLVNSVAGSDHSAAGPLRPTTKDPVVLSSRSRADDYARIGGVACQVVIGRSPILDELTLIDTPDIDSTSTEHRALAETMIDNADIVVYVSSALRYADLVPWEVLRRAHSRGAPVIHVLNRIKSSATGALADYTSRLRLEKLGSEVVAVHEHHMARGAQTIPLAAIQELRERLVEVVEARHVGEADVARSVLDTAIDQAREVIDETTELLSSAIEASSRTRGELSVDLHRIGAGLEFGELGHDYIQRLSDLGSRRFRTRGTIRRRLPTPSEVALGHTLFDESLIAAVDADLHRQLRAIDRIRGRELNDLLSNTHLAARNALTAWHKDLAGMPVLSGALDPSLASLLLERCCFESSAGQLTDVMELLTGTAGFSEAVGQARERLSFHLVPVYSGAEYQVTSRIAGMAASRREIDRAKAARWAVIARSSFANA